MANLDKSAIENLLTTFIDPNLETDLVSAKAVKKISIEDN
ncbi:MAG: iron-sulfur cluster assembly protein, partial [Methylomonas sp.]